MVANSKKLRNVLGLAGACCATTIALSMSSTVVAHAEEQKSSTELSSYLKDESTDSDDTVILTAGVETTLNVSDNETNVSVEKVIEESLDEDGKDDEELDEDDSP